jgi:hypothetical protein
MLYATPVRGPDQRALRRVAVAVDCRQMSFAETVAIEGHSVAED